jgi:hypothetical protein
MRPKRTWPPGAGMLPSLVRLTFRARRLPTIHLASEWRKLVKLYFFV